VGKTPPGKLQHVHSDANIAHHPLLAGRELVDAARYLLLSDGDPVDVLPHRVENPKGAMRSRHIVMDAMSVDK
jgi:hypothetical protein